jgi:hypothetical protein
MISFISKKKGFDMLNFILVLSIIISIIALILIISWNKK